MFVKHFLGVREKEGEREHMARRLKEERHGSLGINTDKPYWGKLFCWRRFADLIFSKRDSISSRTLGVYLTTSFTEP